MTTTSAPWRKGFLTQLKIIRAIRDVYVETGEFSQTAVAARAGVDRHTVSRHFPNLSDALHMVAGEQNLEILLDRIALRPDDESSFCMVVHSFLETVQIVESNDEFVTFLRDNAEFLAETSEAPAILLDLLVRHWFEPITTLLAKRHGRQPNYEDRLAAEKVFVMTHRVLEEWRLGEYRCTLSQITIDLAALLGHHKADGSCLFKAPDT